MKILVTGGAGFIGSHLVDALVAEGHQVRIFDNLVRGRKEFLATHLLSRRVEFVQGDVRDVEAVQKAVQGVEVIFHLAAQSNVLGAVADIEYSFSTNVAGTLNVLKAARKAGVRRVVFASSREVYGEAVELPVHEDQPLRAKNAYGASKIAAEAYCYVFGGDGIEVPVLRLANVYGPRDRDRVVPVFIQRALQGQPLVLYGGDQLIDFIWIGEVVQAFLGAGFREDWPVKQPVNVGSGTGTPIQELAARVLQATQAHVGIQVAPARGPEVMHFVADVRRLRTLVSVSDHWDSLFQLPAVVKYWRICTDRSAE